MGVVSFGTYSWRYPGGTGCTTDARSAGSVAASIQAVCKTPVGSALDAPGTASLTDDAEIEIETSESQGSTFHFI